MLYRGGQSWITQWAKGAAAQGPQSRGAPKAKKKIHIEFDRRHAMQCFMCVCSAWLLSTVESVQFLPARS